MKTKHLSWIVISAVTGLLLTFAIVYSHLLPSTDSPVEEPQGTYMQVFNPTPDSVKVWITLGATDGCLQDVTQIPFITDGSGLQGWFYLAPGDSTIAYAPDSLGYNGVISFGYAPDNCPQPEYLNGLNQFEFMLNNSFQPGNPQESINISCVHGTNCVIRVDMITTNTFNAGPLFPSISTFVNSLDRSAIGLPGVYPYGCDTCTGSKLPPKCIELPQPKQKQAICQIQRPAKQAQGLIKVIYLGVEEPAAK